MKTVLLLMTAIVSALAVRGDDAPKRSEAWQNLARRGKGVCVAKVKKEEAVAFVFFPGANRKMPTSTLHSSGTWFSSLDTAVAFMKKKPSSISVFPADHGALVDDAKILLELSATELKALTEVSDLPSKKEPNQASEPTAPSGRGLP